MHPDIVVVVAGVLGGGVLAQWLGWRLRVPAIVFLLAGGLVAGPLTGALDPDRTFGELLLPMVSIAVAVILFEGALGLGLRGLMAAGRTVWMLLTVGASVTLAGTALAAYHVLGLDRDLSLLLAAILVVTGPTVIGPIVRSIRLKGRLAAILEAEGTLIDPIGAILAVLVFEALFEVEDGAGSIFSGVVYTFGVGAAIGLLAAVILVAALGRYLIPDQLQNATTLASVIGAFAVANGIRAESGLVAVTVMGFALASQNRAPVRHVLEFNETLRILFISGVFVLLGAGIEPDTLRHIEVRSLVFLVVLVTLVRPLSVALSTLASRLSLRERIFLALTAPRGIVAAAIVSVFSLRLAEVGVDDGQILVSAAFTVIAGTVLLSGVGGRFLASRLGLTEAARSTAIVLGANPVAREVATALENHGAEVRLIDLDRRDLAAARMTGLLAHRGSVFADRTWEEAGIGNAGLFLAMTSNDELNTLAARHAAAVIGRRHVFQLAPAHPEHQGWRTLPVGMFGRPLFSNNTTITELAGRLDDGWQVSATKLTEKFGPADFERAHPDAISLFLVDGKGNIEPVAADARRRLRVGETVVALRRARPSARVAAMANGSKTRSRRRRPR